MPLRYPTGSLSGRRDVVPYKGKWSSCAEWEFVRSCYLRRPLHHFVVPLPREWEAKVASLPREEQAPPLRWGMVFVCGGKLPRQAPSVPIRRAGRRAREVVRVMLYALGGEKSPIGGICNSSGAAHLNRRFLREVRSSFFFVGNWSGRAVERHARQLLFVTFSYSLLLAMSGEQKKFIKTPFRGGKESLCAEGSVCGNGVNCPLSPTTWELPLRGSLSAGRFATCGIPYR